MKSTLEAGTGAGETSTVDAEWIHPELEAAMLRDRMDPAPYLAYADWLQGQDEPRGWLIVLQHALRHRPSPPGHPMRRTVLPPAGKRAPPLENEAELLMDEQRFAHQHLFGWRVPMATHHPPFVRLRWQLGFVHDLVFRVGEAIGREPGLEALDLSMAPLTDQGVRQVLQHADQFRHLRTFALCTATEEQRDQLMQAIPRVRAQSQGRTL